MNFILSLILAWITLLQCFHASDLYYEMCGKDVDQFCPNLHSVSDSQVCLRKTPNRISMPCRQYLELDKPAIIESCSQEIVSFCSKVTAETHLIYECLLGVLGDDLSSSCQEALASDRGINQPSEKTIKQPVSVWESCVRYLFEISEGFLSMQLQLIATDWSAKLRGMRNEAIDEATIVLSDNDVDVEID
mmetsp:Transcript_3240/g.3531  ORF Transcript_3240/g.3531 Transcript_3240/m.3531 type:complete len:190 (-) Transcript_3240:181-750(-)